jgi:hypothetical protein
MEVNDWTNNISADDYDFAKKSTIDENADVQT